MDWKLLYSSGVQQVLCYWVSAFSPHSVPSLGQREPARTTTWTRVNWSTCWCSGRQSWRGRGRSLSSRNVCWRSGRWSWRSWSRRSEIWRTTLTRCWCASWSRSPLSCKCGPSWSDKGFLHPFPFTLNSTTSSLVFSLLCCPFWYKYRGTERCWGDAFWTALVKGSGSNGSECSWFSGRFQVHTARWF